MQQTTVFVLCCFFKNNKYGMIFHETCLLAEDSRGLSYPIFSKIRMSQNLSFAAVVIGALMVILVFPRKQRAD